MTTAGRLCTNDEQDSELAFVATSMYSSACWSEVKTSFANSTWTPEPVTKNSLSNRTGYRDVNTPQLPHDECRVFQHSSDALMHDGRWHVNVERQTELQTIYRTHLCTGTSDISDNSCNGVIEK